VVSQQNADIADTLQLRDVAMATIFWLSLYGAHIGTTWRIRRRCGLMSDHFHHLL